VDSLGRVVDTTGQPIPNCTGHAWGAFTYDAYRKQFRCGFSVGYGINELRPGGTAIDEGLTLLQTQGAGNKGVTFGPWIYNTLTGKFELHLANPEPYTGTFGEFVYVPSNRKFLSIGGGGVASFDPETDHWSRVTVKGTNPGGYEFGVCYDSKRDRFYLGDILDRFYKYDVQTETGTKINTSETYPMDFTMNRGSACYDSINDVVVIFDFGAHEIYLFDPESDAWRGAIPFDNAITNQTNVAIYDPQLGVFFIFTSGDSDDRGVMWVYKFRGPTVVEKEKSLRSVKLIADGASVEQYLSTQLKIVQTYQSAPTDTTSSFLAAIVNNLTPSKITISGTGLLLAVDTGTARIAIEKKGFKDTLIIPIVTSTAPIDSLVISPDTMRFLAGDSFHLTSTGYFHKDAMTFSRCLDTIAVWQSALPSVVTVDRGNLHGVSAGGPVEITASHNGKLAKAYVVIWPRPAFIKRINFQCASSPWSYGWDFDNGLAYSSVSGRGWLNTNGLSCRDDRIGSTNYLLNTFVFHGIRAEYKINVPDGSYIIKGGLGDNSTSDNADTLWYGAEIIAVHSGAGNLVFVDTLIASGGLGLTLTLRGKIDYLVVISNQGLDINTVADDNGLVKNDIGLEKAAGQKPLPLALSISPTPFNPSCRISLSLPAASHVRLDVYNLAGRHVYTLTDGMLSAGTHEFTWSGTDQAGKAVGTGVYPFRLTAGSKVLTTKAVFTK
jgi:hypothetical protein